VTPRSSFVDDVVGGGAQEQRDAVGLVTGTLDVEQALGLVAADGAAAEVVSGGRADVRDDVGAEHLAEELDVGLLGATDGQDALLGEVVLGHVVDALLAEDDVGAGVDDGVDEFLKLRFLLVEEVLELARVVDGELCVDFGLVEFDGVVEQEDVGVVEVGRHPLVDGVLVDDGAFDELRLPTVEPVWVSMLRNSRSATTEPSSASTVTALTASTMSWESSPC